MTMQLLDMSSTILTWPMPLQISWLAQTCIDALRTALHLNSISNFSSYFHISLAFICAERDPPGHIFDESECYSGYSNSYLIIYFLTSSKASKVERWSTDSRAIAQYRTTYVALRFLFSGQQAYVVELPDESFKITFRLDKCRRSS